MVGTVPPTRQQVSYVRIFGSKFQCFWQGKVLLPMESLLAVATERLFVFYVSTVGLLLGGWCVISFVLVLGSVVGSVFIVVADADKDWSTSCEKNVTSKLKVKQVWLL